jgi:hypothetical protein
MVHTTVADTFTRTEWIHVPWGMKIGSRATAQMKSARIILLLAMSLSSWSWPLGMACAWAFDRYDLRLIYPPQGCVPFYIYIGSQYGAIHKVIYVCLVEPMRAMACLLIAPIQCQAELPWNIPKRTVPQCLPSWWQSSLLWLPSSILDSSGCRTD